MSRKIILAILLIFMSLMVAAAIYIFLIYEENKEKINVVLKQKPNIALRIVDRKDRLVANIFEDEFRYYAKFEEIPPRAIETLLAVEDTLFFEHSGINLDAILRAALKNIKYAKYIEGGSTITQQLVKNMALSSKKTIDRKISEMILSIQIERHLTKEQILEKYLNYIYFGHGYYGIKTAAHGYFNKELNQLSLKEMAMLIALPRSPSYYDPTKNIAFNLSRANSIVERMLSLGWIDEQEYKEALEEIPTVYNQSLGQNQAYYAVDEAIKQSSFIKDIKTGGYTIKLHLDLDYQQIAVQSLKDGREEILDRLRKKARQELRSEIKELDDDIETIEELIKEKIKEDNINGAIVVTQNQTGKIFALVGGVDYMKSNFNRATQAQRQFGSAIKPFIYQIALDIGYSTASSISDVARSFRGIVNRSDDEEEEDYNQDKSWQPKNYSSSFSGIVTLKDALVKSLNLATLNLVDMVGFSNIYNEMNRYGFNNLQKDLSVALGSVAVSPLDASKYFSIFSNYGVKITPTLIDNIKDFDGNEVYKSKIEEQQLLEPEQAYLTIDLLRSVVLRGTGRRAAVDGLELAGKTGTSSFNNDVWFCGFSPTIGATIWYGRDDNTTIGESESGGVSAAPVFKQLLSNILKIEPGLKRRFDVPEGVFSRKINGNEFLYTNRSKIPKKREEHNLNEQIIF